MANTIRIGGASGFWGDSSLAAPQLVKSGKLDYLVFDYLAEITMSIMARARVKDSAQGYALDFVSQTLRMVLKDCADQGIKIISNAGGVNPLACGKAIEALAGELGLNLKVAVVTGDDLIGRAEDFRARGVTEMFSGAPFPAAPMSINAYLGAIPIAEALGRGADIVITGRSVDSAVTLGACIHAFRWSLDDYDRLASGCLAGHIIECGAQATGGLFTDWEEVPNWANIGYPIAEVAADGSFIISKPPGTGGLVSVATVAEQLLYEIGDPQAYILPDVVCDFTTVQIEQLDAEQVRVSGARGRSPTDSYKVSATYQDGHGISIFIPISGIDADRKALKTGEAVLARVREMMRQRNVADFSETRIEIIGAEAEYGPLRRVSSIREVVLKLSAKHGSAQILSALLREATSSGTSMSPGTSGMGGTRPKPSPIVRLFSFLLPKTEVSVRVHQAGETYDVAIPAGQPLDIASLVRPEPAKGYVVAEPMVDVPLVALAWGRSGDKGDVANIGVIARKAEYLPWIRASLSEEAVGAYFAHLMEGQVERFEVPGINALNFVLHQSLGGGGIASLRKDPQGKAYAQLLLDCPIKVPRTLAEHDELAIASED